MKKIFLILSIITSVAFTSHHAELTENNYRIYSTKLGKEVNLNDIINEIKDYDILIYGEEHNDSVSHYLEAKLLTLMFKKFNSNTALSMEMFDRDVQTVMNEYLSGLIKEKHFLKDARVWSNYRDYKPMVEFAKLNHLNVICANSASRYTNLAGRKGQAALMSLPKSSKLFFAPLPYDTAEGKYYEKLTGLSNHGPATKTDTAKNKLPVSMMGSFNLIMAQSLWDATMAYSIAEFLKSNKGKKVFQVNGKFHSDEGFAIVTQLKKYNKKLKPLIISSTSDERFPNIDWSKYATICDYMIITDPQVPKTYKSN